MTLESSRDIRQRLLQVAGERGELFERVLERYARALWFARLASADGGEELVARIAASPVLLWTGPPPRPNTHAWRLVDLKLASPSRRTAGPPKRRIPQVGGITEYGSAPRLLPERPPPSGACPAA